MTMDSEFSKRMYTSAVLRMIRQQKEMEESPWYQRYRKKLRDEWNAKPWHEKARILIKSKIGSWRTRLGEWIAGREFE